MNDVQVFDDSTRLAEMVAKQTCDALKDAIREYGSAVWVIAGGSTPLAAYKVVAEQYTDALGWSLVTMIMGDERIGPSDGPDNNWHQIDRILGSLPAKKIIPNSNQSAEDAASEYESQITKLPHSEKGVPRLDVVWLGMGADGHTLSLFPSHSSILPNAKLVIPVHDSPKPPADRISLTLRAMQGSVTAMIMATGADKKPAIKQALDGGHTPIALVANIVKTHRGKVSWFVDKDANPTD